MAQPQWAGLITNASPYAIPPGAAVEQTNLSSAVPGQLATRGGMMPVQFDAGGNASGALDIYPYVHGNSVKLLVLTSGGAVAAVSSPIYGTAPSSPVEPVLSPGANQVRSSYTGRFHDAGGEAPA